MVIEKEQLISLLKKKTSLEREQIEAQLSELADGIKEAAKQGKTFHVEELGTFGISNDNLQFVPNDTLKMEINTKYAGMKPIELIGAFKEPDTDEIPVPDDIQSEVHTDPVTFEEKTADSESTDKKTSPPEKEIVSEKKNKKGVEEDVQQEPEPAPISSAEKAENKSKPTPKKPVRKPRTEKKPVAKSQKDPVGRILAAIVFLLVLGIIGWFVYDLGYFGNQNTNSTAQSFSPQTTQKPKDGASEQQGDNSGADSPQNSNAETGKEAPDTKPKATQNEQVSTKQGMASQTEKNQSYGLMGDVVPEIGKAYMIVVHSRRRMDLAQENKQELESKNYRTIINRTDVNGKTQFRVGIGQFKTIQTALQSIKKLPEPYKSNNFITRIR